ncbi:MAG: hypothetical protein ABW189_01175 [Rickettsiales bacterium]
MAPYGKTNEEGKDKRVLPENIIFGMDTLDILNSPPPMYELTLKLRQGGEKTEQGMAEVICDYLRIDGGKSQALWSHLLQNGEAVCAVYTREVAETKMGELNYLLRSKACPAFCAMRKNESVEKSL